MENKVVIRAKNLTKEYKIYKRNTQKLKAAFTGKGNGISRLAVNDVTFDIHKGDKVAIIGKLGSGRTTLLKLLAGITFPTSGSIQVKETVEPMLELRAGFDGELTGRQNLFIKGSILGKSKQELKEKEEEIIEFSGLRDFIDLPLKTYAPGMGGRLGFTVQTTFKPQILVMDENFVVGDKKYRQKCIQRLSDIVNQEDVTFVMVTRNFILARRLCTSALVMDKGKVMFHGEINEAIEYFKKNLAAKDVKSEEEQMEDRALELQLEDEEENEIF